LLSSFYYYCFGIHHQVSIRAIKNARITMEDEYCIHDNAFYAIFDGHGGGGVSKYLKQHLYETVMSYVRGSGGQHDVGEAPARALQSAFSDIERHVTTNESLRYQGSTAVVVWITENEIIAANVGDSRAILSRGGRAIPLTRDHKPNDEIERDRILQMGESIAWDRFSKVHRVKNLSLSRAIGDAYAKPVVSATVDIKHFPLQTGITTTAAAAAPTTSTNKEDPAGNNNNNHHSNKDEFVILASDGLWDVFTSDDAVAFCHSKLKELDRSIDDVTDRANGQTVLRRNMAKFLTREAVARGSGTYRNEWPPGNARTPKTNCNENRAHVPHTTGFWFDPSFLSLSLLPQL
jgi:serine/threonine protein phosphatase PrpC